MIPLLVLVCVLQVITVGLLVLMQLRLSRLETHVIELKTWQIGMALQERRDLDELAQLSVRWNALHRAGHRDSMGQPGSPTIQ